MFVSKCEKYLSTESERASESITFEMVFDICNTYLQMCCIFDNCKIGSFIYASFGEKILPLLHFAHTASARMTVSLSFHRSTFPLSRQMIYVFVKYY